MWYRKHSFVVCFEFLVPFRVYQMSHSAFADSSQSRCLSEIKKTLEGNKEKLHVSHVLSPQSIVISEQISSPSLVLSGAAGVLLFDAREFLILRTQGNFQENLVLCGKKSVSWNHSGVQREILVAASMLQSQGFECPDNHGTFTFSSKSGQWNCPYMS